MSDIYTQQLALLHIIDRTLDNFKKIGKKNYTAVKIRMRIASLKETLAQCIKMHAALLHSTPETTRHTMEYFQQQHFDVANEVVQSTLDYMAECLEEVDIGGRSTASTDSSSAGVGNEQSSFSVNHLPTIHLPQFSGKFEEWESFRDRFTSLIVNNKSLSAFARMHFLTSSLSGRALEAIGNIAVTADNFDIAWKTLTSQFENKRRLVEVHVSALFNLPTVSRASASELNALRNKANHAIASLKNLKRSPEEILDDILVYAVSHQLNHATRTAWKMRGSETSEIPRYYELDQFLTARARVLDELAPLTTKPVRPSRASTVAAANVSTLECGLCKAAHFLNKCPLFIRKSPSQRLELIRQLNRCTNCLSAKHGLSSCPSRYSYRTCNRPHHTMLHVDSPSSAEHRLQPHMRR